MERRRWIREELIRVMALYCQLPFGKMHSHNPAVVALASAIDRTPSAVALKLVNFASLDPELQARGIGGMPNVSQADRDIWQEFYGRWEQLAEASVVDAVEEVQRSAERQRASEATRPDGPTEETRETRVRRGQSFFRATVMAAHDWKCCVTGISALELLRASHIIPWSQNPEQRLNPRNGLCLNALHDAAFDRGLITFSATFELCVSARLCNEIPAAIYDEMFAKKCGQPIHMPERFAPLGEMLEYHRTEIYCG